MATTRTKHGTLVANEITTVTLTREYTYVDVVNRTGTAEIFFSVDSSDPVIDADDVFMLPAAICVSTVKAGGSSRDDQVVVKLISSGSPKYSVEGS